MAIWRSGNGVCNVNEVTLRRLPPGSTEMVSTEMGDRSRAYRLGMCGGATGRALDLRSTGRVFKSNSGQKLRNNLGQVVHTYVPLSPSSINWYRPRSGDALRLER